MAALVDGSFVFQQGGVFVFYGQNAALPNAAHDVFIPVAGLAWFTPTLLKMAAADMNGDGCKDLIIGTDIYYGTAGGVMNAVLDNTITHPEAATPALAARAGDIDGDGIDDLILGINPTYVYFGSSSQNPITTRVLVSTGNANVGLATGGPLPAANGMGALEFSASSAGRFSGANAFDDIVIGTPLYTAGSTYGRVTVYKGSSTAKTDGSLAVFQVYTETAVPANLSGLGSPAASFGFALAAGRIGTDGRSVIAVGAPTECSNTRSATRRAGTVYSIDGRGYPVDIQGNSALGSAAVGNSLAPATFTVKNASDAVNSATAVSVALGGTDAANFSIDTTGLDVSYAAGASDTFTVTFTPLSNGAKTATLTVAYTYGAQSYSYVRQITATATDYILTVTVPVSKAIDFGSTPRYTTTAPQTITVRNDGSLAATVSAAKTGTNPTDFTVAPAGSQVIAVGTTADWTVTFSPGALLVRSATVNFSAVEGGTPDSCAVSGTGLFALPPPQSSTSGFAEGAIPSLGYTVVDFGANTVGTDMNDSGEVSGYAIGTGTLKVWAKTGTLIWSDATASHGAWGINDDGEITSTRRSSSWQDPVQQRHWSADGTVSHLLVQSTTELPPGSIWRTNAGQSGQAMDLFNNNYGIGMWKNGSSHPYPVIWNVQASPYQFTLLPHDTSALVAQTTHRGPMRVNKDGWIVGGIFKPTVTTAPWTDGQTARAFPAVWIPGARMQHPTGPTLLPAGQFLNNYNLIYLPLSGGAWLASALVNTAPLGLTDVTGGNTVWAVGYTAHNAVFPANAYPRSPGIWKTTDSGYTWTHVVPPRFNPSGWTGSFGGGFQDVNDSHVCVGWGELLETDNNTAEAYRPSADGAWLDTADRACVMDAAGYYPIDANLLNPNPGTISTFNKAVAIANDGTILVNARGVDSTWHAVLLVPLASGPPVLEVTVPVSKAVDFGNVLLSTASTPVPITVRNTGGMAGTVTPVIFGGPDDADFTIVEGTQVIAAGGTRTWNVIFTPGALNARSSAIGFEAVEDTLAEGTDSATLTGNGVNSIPVPSLTVTTPVGKSIAFGSVLVGSTSGSQTIIVQNNGTANATVTPAKTGTHTGDFTVIEGQQTITSGGGTATWTVTFTPGLVGARGPASIDFLATEGGTGDACTVSGTGLPLDPDIVLLDPNDTVIASGGTYTFGLVRRGSERLAQLTIRNDPGAGGTLNLTGTPLLVNKTGGAAVITVSSQPGVSSLAPGAETTFIVRFAPAGDPPTVSASATFSIESNDPGTPLIFTVTGNGHMGTLIRLQ